MRYLSSAMIMCGALFAGSASYADDLWRCPNNVYTNQALDADIKSGRCVLVSNDVSVVPAPRSGSGGGGMASPRSDGGVTQGGGQSSPRAVQAQIDRAVNELNALEDEYNNGDPQRIGPEFRNYQKYLDRVERLKNEIEAKKQEIETLRTQL